MKKDFTPENELLFLALGGSGEIGMNVNLYGCDGKWMMVDLGMTFSGGEYPGVDLVFADLDFIEERTEDLLGISEWIPRMQDDTLVRRGGPFDLGSVQRTRRVGRA